MEFQTYSYGEGLEYHCDLVLKNPGFKTIIIKQEDDTDYGITQISLHHLSKQDLFDLKCVIERELFDL